MEEELSYKIIGCAIEVHRILGGPGLLESIYESALCHELTLQGLQIERQLHIPVCYKGIKIKDSLCLDIMVENRIVVEVKAVEKANPIFETQILTYLRLTGCRLGLLINFGNKYIKEGVSRIING